MVLCFGFYIIITTFACLWCSASPTAIDNDRQLETVANLPVEEWNALYDLYNSTDGPMWVCCIGSYTRWNFTNASTNNPCTDNWKGVTCDVSGVPPQYFVSQLYLSVSNLRGTIPATIQNLTGLNHLFITANIYLSGELPSSLGNMVSLTNLDLSYNAFTGTVPEVVGKLDKLVIFNVGGNHLTGTFVQSYCSLLNIVELHNELNVISGSIPSCFGGLTALTYWNIWGNIISGTIPSSIGNLTSMVGLVANSNSISGTLPSSLGLLTNLGGLLFYVNYLSGSIPDTLGNMTHCESFMVYDNFLTGTLPNSLGKLEKLYSIYLFTNSLSGSLPSEFGSLSNMDSFAFYDNCLTGSIPNSYVNMEKLNVLYMQENFLTGTIPYGFASTTKMRYFYFSMNSLTGTLPASLGEMVNLAIFNIGDNSLSGTVLSSFSQFYQLEEYSVFKNHFSGTLYNIFNASVQEKLNNIQVDSNQFTGTLPNELFSLVKLQTFIASTNCFHGTLPDFSLLPDNALYQLILNGLSSSPACQNRILPGLSSSYLLTSAVTGPIPSVLFQLPVLNTLQLSGNGFHVSLPVLDVISPLLLSITLSHNRLKGVIPSYIQNGLFESIDLSYNLFGGTLLPSFNSSTTNISLENNRISGEIPGSLSNTAVISLLGTNIFSCNFQKSDLPDHVKEKESYKCASTDFDIPYYIWLGLCIVTIGLVALVVSWGDRIFKSVTVSMWITMAESWLKYSDPEVHSNSVAFVGQICNLVVYLTMYCTVYILFVLLPVWCILSAFYGSYTYQYAYNVSMAFVSGVVPFCLAFVLLFAMLGCLFYCVVLLSDTHGAAQVRTSWNTSAEAENCSSSLRSRVNSSKSRVISISRLIMHTQQNDEKLPAVKTFKFCFLFGIINVIVVVGCNVLFVLAVLYGPSKYIYMAQLAMSAFKLLWNDVGFKAVLNFVAQLVFKHSNPREISNKFITLQITMAIVNNIVIPFFAALIVSPYCFYDVFEAPPAVSSRISTTFCVIIGDHCEFPVPVERDAFYSPPFQYSYLCSSSILRSYAAVYVTLCIGTTFILSSAQLALLHWYKTAVPGSRWFAFVDKLLPPVLKPLSNGSSSGKEVYFDGQKLMVTFSIYFSILLTFGTVFPPLAVAVALTIWSVAYGTRLKIGRFLAGANDVCGTEKCAYEKYLEDDCGMIQSISVLKFLIFAVFCTSCLFYSLFLFDILGDSVHFKGAVWVPIVFLLLPLCAWVCLTVLTSRKKQKGCESVIEVQMSSLEAESGDSGDSNSSNVEMDIAAKETFNTMQQRVRC